MGFFTIFVWVFIQENIFISSSTNSIAQGVFLFLIGKWTRKAALGFSNIVETTNNDIENLLGAIGELRKLYTLLYNLVIIALAFIIVFFIIAIITNLITASG